MKLFFKILIAVISAGAIAGYIYWQKNKKQIIRNTIEKTVEKKTDSLYFIQYDSSQIDAINGNASFYKVRLQSDSAQKEILKSSDSLPAALYFINVDKVSAEGINMIGMLQKQTMSAKTIVLNKPVVQIINTGVDKPKPFTYNDTLELYQKILGKFKSIHADTIRVVSGTVLITDRKGKALTTLENINITLNNFQVDSTRDYQNIISYFIKDVKATVENIQLPELSDGSRVNITGLLYDAPAKILQANSIRQYRKENSTAIVDIKNTRVTALNTDAFILYQQLKAGLLTCDGGLITIYTKKKKSKSGTETIEFSNELSNGVKIDGLQLNKTQIIVIDLSKPDEPPLVIRDVKFSASKIANVKDGSNLSDLINNAAWELSAGRFSIVTKDHLYELSATGVQVNNKNHSAKIKRVWMMPLLSETKFMSLSKEQKDRYDFQFNNIELQGLNINKLISDNVLEIQKASLQPNLKIFNDRSLTPGTKSKIGKYPHQSLVKLPFPFYIKEITVKNGSVFYKEKAKKSQMEGEPNFTNINGIISNVTNIPAKIKENPTLHLNAKSLFLGTTALSTEWLLPLAATDTTFTVTGEIGPMDATLLNQITEPLAMLSIKKGKVNKLIFNLKGTDYKGTGTAIFLYNDLQVTVLKMNDDELKKKGLSTFFANTLIKNDNPRNGDTYTAEIDFDRNAHKSFFNLLWKSIFDGIKKTALRK